MDKKLDMDIVKALQEDEVLKEGNDEYERIMEQANRVAEEITSALATEIVRQNEQGEKANTFTLTTAIVAVATSMIQLCTYLYKDEKEYQDVLQEARRAVIDRVIPAILNPQPCGECPDCKVGKPCTNPVMDDKLLQSRSVPIIAASLVHYDIWNKIMALYVSQEEKEGK